MYTRIASVVPGGIASKSVIAPGDVLRRINGNPIGDVLDYQYHSYDSRLLLELTAQCGKIKLVSISKPEGADLGLEFVSSLMDKQQSCGNKCIFCFIDQLPKGMRETLYYKDDDVRLSFLQGNYVTLTNLGRDDIERIIKLRISPVNVSVHTLNPQLRQFMQRPVSESGENGGNPCTDPHEYIATLANAGIKLNCQIVCCPGLNDKQELQRTMEGLEKLGPGINSVSIVPVGLTKHREGLYSLQPFNRKLARQTIRQVEAFGKKCIKKRGSAVFYCADELYMLAGHKLPPAGYYQDYPQLENGVGMMRLFITEFTDAMKRRKPGMNPCLKTAIATGTLAAPYLAKLLHAFTKKYGKIDCRIYPIKNNFFGESITVSGLVTGADIIRQLKGRNLGNRLLIPQNMLRRNDVVFLDDVTADDLSEELGVPVAIVGQNGGELFKALFENTEDGNA